MVEITFEIMLSTLQTVSIIIGIFYYLTILRNTQKTRRAENLRWFLEDRSNEEKILKYAWAMNLKWDNYEDFQSKFGRDTNPETWSRLWSFLVKWDDIGLMVNRNVIDIADLYELSGRSIPSIWMKYKPIIEEVRKRDDSTSMLWFQHLIEEMQKESNRRGDNYLSNIT